MKLFGKEEVNVGRQFEFDAAKAVCILGMVFVHCLEMLASPEEETLISYVLDTVLDSVFGAGTFMFCMGLGIAYNRKNTPGMLMKRGIVLFLLGYVLNLLRGAIPGAIVALTGAVEWEDVLLDLLCDDILPFAGLALFLFGLLKKLKFSDLALLLTALGMSLLGSFVRFLDTGNYPLNELAGLFVGITDLENDPYADYIACFPLLNWFLTVVIGYLYASLLRRCRDVHRYYKIALPVTSVILAVYLALSIPGRHGMMSGTIQYYYQFTTPEALILFAGAIFATSVYHFISLLLSDKAKRFITMLSANINSVYCIHWVILGWVYFAMRLQTDGFLPDWAAVLAGVIIYPLSNLLAWVYRQKIKKKKTPEGENACE